MGPRSRERGDQLNLATNELQRIASMGPRSRERGDEAFPGVLERINALQWGRAHVSAEILTVRGRARHLLECFNGAALT